MSGGATQAISGWAGGSASVTLGAAQALYGVYLDRKAQKMPHDYSIPPEIQQNLTQAQMMALEGMPAEQKQQYIENLNRSTAYSLNNLSDLKSGLRGVAGANDQFNQGYGNLLSMDSQARINNQNNLYGMRQNLADYKDKAWQFNVKNPYDEMRLKASGFQGAGLQNMSQGFQSGNTGGNPFEKSQPAPQQTPPSQNQYLGRNVDYGYGVNGTSPNNPNAPQGVSNNWYNNPNAQYGYTR